MYDTTALTHSHSRALRYVGYCFFVNDTKLQLMAQDLFDVLLMFFCEPSEDPAKY